MTTPRVFIVRHGETEWSLNGRHTGKSDIPLTANGEQRMLATGSALVGDDRLITPRRLAHIFVSPRTRAQRTLQLLLHGLDHNEGKIQAKIEVTDRVAEWDYGDYEGITSAQIAAQRERDGIPGQWDIWRDGCPGGESPAEITARLDSLIAEIRAKYHAPAIGKKPKGEQDPCDVLVVAHGHILRALAGRWVNQDIARNPSLILEAGGVGTLSYEHCRLDEPAILLGGAFMADVLENSNESKTSL